MCPFCLATVAWIALGATSVGGISALAVKRSRDTNNERITRNGNSDQGGSREHEQGYE
jgi:hypothetical protein